MNGPSNEAPNALINAIGAIVPAVIGAHGISITQEHSKKANLGRIKRDFVGMNEIVGKYSALDGMLQTFESDSPNFVALRKLTDDLVENLQVILKGNWNRVRTG